MKALMISLFLTLVAMNAFGQIPAEVDYKTRLAEYNQAQDRFLKLEERAKLLKIQAEQLNAQLTEAELKLQRRKDKRKVNKARLTEIEELIVSSINKTTELTATLKGLKAKELEIKSRALKLAEVSNNKKVKLEQIRPQIQETENKLKILDTESVSINSEIKNATAKYNAAKKTSLEAKAKLDQISKTMADQKTKIAGQRKVLKSLPAESPKAKILKKAILAEQGKLESYKKKQSVQSESLKVSKEKMAQNQTVLKNLNLKITELKKKKDAIKNAAGGIYQKFEEAKVALKVATENEANAKENLKKITEDIAKNGSKINNHKTKLVKLRQEKKSITAEQLKIKDDVVRLSYQINNLVPRVNNNWAIFEEAKLQKQKANQRAERLYAIYQETKTRYNTFMSAAISAGQNQAQSLGINLGSENGDQLGDANGAKDALIYGKQLGLFKGYLNGLKDGHGSGKDQGYQKGFNLPNNYERGYELGFTAGKEQAYIDAENEDYPKGRIAKQKELLSRALNGESLRGNNSNQSFSMVVDTSYHYEGLKNTNNRASGDAILDLIDSIESKIHEIEREVNLILDNPSSQLEIKVPSVLGSLRCPSQYPANYIEFQEACKESFLAEFNRSYTQSFSDEYNQSYLRNFEKSLSEQEILHQNKRVKEGYQKAFAPTFNKYKLIGAKDAQNKGYNDGHKKAYKETIKNARKLAFEKGQRDEQEYFNTHSVVRILKAGLKSNEGKFIPGAKAKLAIELGNFGSIATQEDQVTLQVFSEDRGLVFTETQSSISSIKGVSKISNNAILEATIGENVQPGQSLAVQVKIYLNGKMVDTQSVIVKGEADYNTIAVVNTNTSPKFRTFSRKETASVVVTNNSRTKLLSNLSVKMSASNSIIDIQNSILNLGVMSKGAKNQVTFEYKGKKKLRGKKITLTFDVLYKGQIIQTQKIDIKPI